LYGKKNKIGSAKGAFLNFRHFNTQVSHTSIQQKL